MNEENKKPQKYRTPIILFAVSLLLLFLKNPALTSPLSQLKASLSTGYLIGSLIRIIVIWSAVLGAIAYPIWRFGFKRRKDLFLFIFSLLFFIATIFHFGVTVYTESIAEKLNSPEFIEKTNNISQEFDSLKQELIHRNLMSALEKQEGKPFEKIPMNIIKDFLNKHSN